MFCTCPIIWRNTLEHSFLLLHYHAYITSVTGLTTITKELKLVCRHLMTMVFKPIINQITFAYWCLQYITIVKDKVILQICRNENTDQPSIMYQRTSMLCILLKGLTVHSHLQYISTKESWSNLYSSFCGQHKGLWQFTSNIRSVETACVHAVKDVWQKAVQRPLKCVEERWRKKENSFSRSKSKWSFCLWKMNF